MRNGAVTAAAWLVVAAALPDAGAADYRDFEDKIVQPWLHRRPDAAFSSVKLFEALVSVRIAAAVLDACPPRFARFAA